MSKNFIRHAAAASLLAMLIVAPVFPHTPDGCETFTWNLAHELAAMKAPSRPIKADRRTPMIPQEAALGTHYSAVLLPQRSVTFIATPARTRDLENAMGGILHFRTEKPGLYRVSLTTHHWIDLVIAGKIVGSRGHEGRSGCEILHKVVEFELPGNAAATIQLSGADAADVGLVITGPA